MTIEVLQTFGQGVKGCRSRCRNEIFRHVLRRPQADPRRRLEERIRLVQVESTSAAKMKRTKVCTAMMQTLSSARRTFRSHPKYLAELHWMELWKNPNSMKT